MNENQTMTPEERRAVWQRSVARNLSAGLAIDTRILSTVEDWIEGKITAKELRDRYQDHLVKKRALSLRTGTRVPVQDEIEILLDDVAVRTPEERARVTEAINHAWDV